jgi:hypothetical protein
MLSDNTWTSTTGEKTRIGSLVAQVGHELLNTDFTGRKHYSRSTYKDGCHGPLCLKAERDKAARRYAARNPDRKPMERNAWQIARDEYLETVINAMGLRSEMQAKTLAS